MVEMAVRKAAQRLRKRAGAKPGKSRFAKLTDEEKSAVGRHAVQARWAKAREVKDATEEEHEAR